MTALLLQIGATKLAVSVVLAGAVWMVHRRVDRPAISHPLWLMVLVTLLVPAVVSLPVLPAEFAAPLATWRAGASEFMLAEGTSYQSTGPPLGAAAPTALAILWLLGTTGFLGWTLARTILFRRTLARASCQAPASLQRQAAGIGLPRTRAGPDPGSAYHERPRDANGLVDRGEGTGADSRLPSGRTEPCGNCMPS